MSTLSGSIYALRFGVPVKLSICPLLNSDKRSHCPPEPGYSVIGIMNETSLSTIQAKQRHTMYSVHLQHDVVNGP
jgi:hypothetical protein